MADMTDFGQEVLQQAIEAFEQAKQVGSSNANSIQQAQQRVERLIEESNVSGDQAQEIISNVREELVKRLIQDGWFTEAESSALESAFSQEDPTAGLGQDVQDQAIRGYEKQVASGAERTMALDLSVESAFQMAMDGGATSEEAEKISNDVREALINRYGLDGGGEEQPEVEYENPLEMVEGSGEEFGVPGEDGAGGEQNPESQDSGDDSTGFGEGQGSPTSMMFGNSPLPDLDNLNPIDAMDNIGVDFDGGGDGDGGTGETSGAEDTGYVAVNERDREDSGEQPQDDGPDASDAEDYWEASDVPENDPVAETEVTEDVEVIPTARVSVRAEQSEVIEGGQGYITFTVTRSHGIGESSVRWSITGDVEGSDFVQGSLPSGSVSFADGQTSRTVTVMVGDDFTLEDAKTIRISLSNPGQNLELGSAQDEIRLIDDDFSYEISAGDSREEGDSDTTLFTFTVTRDGSLQEETSVDWQLRANGSEAEADSADFHPGQDLLGNNGGLPSGVVTFAPGESVKTIEIQAAGDTEIEPDEGFSVELLNNEEGNLNLSVASADAVIQADDISISVSSAALAVREGGDGSTQELLFTVVRDGDLNSPVSVAWSADGLGEDDFLPGVSLSGTTLFAEGEVSKTISLTLEGDRLLETDETLVVSLENPEENPSYARTYIVQGSASIEIVNDDALLSVAADAPGHPEGHGGQTLHTFTVTREGDSSTDQSVDWHLTLPDGAQSASIADFTPGQDGLGDNGGLPSGTLTFAPGETTATLTVAVAGDTEIEGDESFTITLTNDDDGNMDIGVASVENTIFTDDIGIGIASASLSTPEGGTEEVRELEFTVTRSGDTDAAVELNWHALGMDADDFSAESSLSGRLSFASGEVSKTIRLYLEGDNLLEADETLTIELENPLDNPSRENTFLTTPSASVTVTNDDTEVGIAADTASLFEGDGDATVFLFTVTRSGDLMQEQTVDFRTVLEGSTTTDDFMAGQDLLGDNGGLPSGTVTFLPGESEKEIEIRTLGDTVVEPDESFSVVITGDGESNMDIVSSRASATILGDDIGIAVRAMAGSIEEGEDGATTDLVFTVTRTGNLDEVVEINWSAAGMDASDFVADTPFSGTVHFAAGETVQQIRLSVANDVIVEPDETLGITLENPESNPSYEQTYLLEDFAAVDVVNDDYGYQIMSNIQSVLEGSSSETTDVTFIVSRSVDTDLAATIDFRAVPGGSNPATTADFTPGQDLLGDNNGMPSGTVEFAAGETEKEITVQVQGDDAIGPDEMFSVVLSNQPEGTQILISSAAVAIENDDALVFISAVNPVQDEGSGVPTSFQFSVTRTGDLTSATEVGYVVSPYGESPISAADIEGGEYVGGTVSFLEGESQALVTVEVAGDSILEGNEYFQVNLLDSGDNLEILGGAAVATINEDDAGIIIEATDATRIEGNEVDQPQTFQIIRTGNLDQETVVNWGVQPGGDNAADAGDFLDNTLPAGSVTFSPGETVKTITVTPTADIVYEPTETYDVVLSLPEAGAVLLTGAARGIILNDEAGLSLSATDITQMEGHSGTTVFSFTVTRIGATNSAVTVDWSLGATGENGVQAEDFAGGVFPSGSLEFAKGVSSRIVQFEVATDSIVEGDETFAITLSNPGPGADIVVGEIEGSIVNDDAAFAITEGQTEKLEGQSGDTLYSFTVTRSGDTTGSDSVSYTVSGSGDAAATPDDFGGSFETGSLVFAPGETEKTINIAVSGDDDIEGDESFLVTLHDPGTGAQLVAGEESAVTTIVNDDDQFTLSPVTGDVTEGGDGAANTITFTIDRSGSLATTSTVNWAMTGSVSAADVDATSGSVEFAPGETQKTVTVTVVGDYAIEGDEEFSIALTSASVGSNIDGGTIGGTILNDDVGLAISPVTTDLGEGDSGTVQHSFTIVRTGVSTGETSVDWAVSGFGDNSADGGDFGSILPSGTVLFAAGETEKLVQFESTGDVDIEATEGFMVTLTNPEGENSDITTDRAEGSIVADDIGIALSSGQTLVTEGADGANQVLQFTVTRSGDVASPVSIDWAAAGMDGGDFSGATNLSGTLDFGVNEVSKTIYLNLTGDSSVEPDETLTITLTNPEDNPAYARTILTSDSATTIVENDDSSLTLSAAENSLSEGDSDVTSFTFTITRGGELSGDQTVNWSVELPGGAGSASINDFASGQDGLGTNSGLPSGSVVIPEGQESVDITVDVTTDTIVELDETFAVVLSSPDENTELAGASVTATIANDDMGFSIVALDAEQQEGQSGTTDYTFQVNRAGDTDQDAYVDWSVAGSSGEPADSTDFGGTLPSGTIFFASGEAAKTITVSVSSETDVESDEGFTVTLANARLGDDTPQNIVDATASATIINDDQSFSVAAANTTIAEGSSGTTQVVYTITRSGDTTGEATVDYTVTAENGGDGNDLSGASLPAGTLTFAPGVIEKTVAFDVIGDLVAEGDETFNLTLTNPSTGVLGAESASTVVVNDDTNFSVSAPEAASEGTTGETTIYTFTVTRSGDTGSTGSVSWKIGAAAGLTTADFISGQDVLGTNLGLPSGTVSFLAGETTKDITVQVKGDVALEGDETLQLELSGVTGGVILSGDETAATTILSDDDSFAISTATTEMAEGHSDSTVTYTITRTGSLDGSRELTWTITGVDAADLGDSQPMTGTVSFIDGQESIDIAVSVKGDSVSENDETMTLTLSGAPDNSIIETQSASTLITNDDASVAITALQADRVEGNFSADSGDVPADTTTSTTVGFDGVVYGEIETSGDRDWYRVDLIAGHTYDFHMTGSTTGEGTLQYATIEGIYTESGTNLGYYANRYTGDDSNDARTSFTPTESGTYFVEARSYYTGDSYVGTYALAVSDETAPGSDVSSHPVSLVDYTFTVTRSGYTTQESTVEYRVAGGTDPVSASDFLGSTDALGDNNGLPSGTVTFAEGETSKTVTIQILADSDLEPDETLQVNLSNSSDGTEIVTATASGVVRNDDAELNITAGTAELLEGDNGHSTSVAYTYTVTRTGNLDQVTTVDWVVDHGTTTSADFSNGVDESITPSGTVTFSAGETEKTITVYINGDTGINSVEDDETFTVKLTNPNPGNSIGDTGAFNSTIVNDDTALTLSVDDYSQVEAKSGETTTYTYTVTRSGYLEGTTDYSWNVITTNPTYNYPAYVNDYSSGSSIFEYPAGTDDFASGYPTGTGSFAAGEVTDTFTVTVQGDDNPEDDQWFVTKIAATSGYDEVWTVYDNPDLVDGTLLLRTYYPTYNYYYDNQPASSSYNEVDANIGYIYTEIVRDEALFYLSDREVADETVQTLSPGNDLYQRDEGDTPEDGGTNVITVTVDGVEYSYLQHIFAVQRQVSTEGDASVDWRVGTYYSDAVEADDFYDLTFDVDGNVTAVATATALPSGTATFADGQEWAYVKFYTVVDDTGEYDESFSVYLENPSAGSSVYTYDDYNDRNSNTGYLLNDDTRFDASVNDTEEGGTLTYTITRTGDTRGTDTVDWSLILPGSEATNESNSDTTSWYDLDPSDIASVTAENGSPAFADGTWSGTLTFTDGETTKTITVVTNDDSWTETWREELPISLSNATNIDAGEENHDLEIAATGYTDVARVYDNEPDPLISVSVDKETTYEGTATGNTVTFTVTRTDDTALDGSLDYPTTVVWRIDGSYINWSSAGGTAEIISYTGDASDVYEPSYNQTYGLVSFAAGESTKDVVVTFNADNFVEADRTLTFTTLTPEQALGWPKYSDLYGPADVDPAGASVSTVLKNDDVRLWVNGWDTSNYSNDTYGYYTNVETSAYEGNPLTFSVVRGGRLDSAIVVSYEIITGTAASGDFTTTSGTFTLDAQDTSYGTYTYNISLSDILSDDTTIEADEDFTLRLTTPADSEGSTVLFQSSYTDFNNNYTTPSTTLDLRGTIYDDDTNYTLTPASTSLDELDSGSDQTWSFTIDRTADGYTGAAILKWKVVPVGSDGAEGTDFSSSDTLGVADGLPSGTVSFASGELTKQFTIQVDGDDLAENNETFQVVIYEDVLTSADPDVVNSQAIASADLTIVTDDVGIAIGDAEIVESDSDQQLTFTVTRSGDLTGTSTMDWSLLHSGTSAADFTGETSGSISFGVGETSKNITVTVAGDTDPENTENFTIQLSNLVNVDQLIDISGSGAIINDDSAFAISAETGASSESSAQTFTITRTRDTSQEQTVNWEVQPDDADAADFGGVLPSGSVTFAPTEMTKTITITPSDDTTAETNENYNVVISLAEGTTGDTITTASAVGTIENDDAAYIIDSAQTSINEGDSGTTTYTFTVTRSGNTGGTGSVDWRLTGGETIVDDFTTADNLGDNGGLPSGTVNFAEGETTKEVVVNISTNETIESDEVFNVTLSNPAGGEILESAVSATLVDDDSTISIAAASAVHSEGDDGVTAYTFTVTRTGYLGEAETVDYAITGSGANGADGDDFGGSLPSGTLSLPAGEASVTLTVNVAGDVIAEADEEFTVTLSNPSSGVSITQATATGSIMADDVVFSVAAPEAVYEGAEGTTTDLSFVVTRSGVLSSSQTLSWSLAGVGADGADSSDFSAVTGEITFAADETQKTIHVEVVGDYQYEADETFRLTLEGPQGVVFTSNTADSTILNDEASLVITATDANKVEGADGVTSYTFTVTRSGNTDIEAGVDWGVVAGDTDSADYATGTLPAGSLVFAAGETSKTVTVEVAGDSDVETNEQFSVELSNSSAGAEIVTGSATGTIRSDDVQWTITAITAASEEGDTTTDFTFRVTRTGGDAATTIDWSAATSGSDGATAADFLGNLLPSGTLAFSQGQMSQDFTITINGDDLLEGDEGFTVTLAEPADGQTHSFDQQSADATITNDDDVMSLISLTENNSEDGGSFSFKVIRTGALTGVSTIGWQIVAGSADAADFGATSGVVSFASGQSEALFTIPVINDRDVEMSETFTVALTAPGDGSTIDSVAGEVSETITDNDIDLTLVPLTSLAQEGDQSGGQLQYKVVRSGVTDQELSVDWTIEGDIDSADFVGQLSGTVTFAAGETEQYITLNIAPDGLDEGTENFTLTLSSPSLDADFVANGQTGTIVNDDDTLTIGYGDEPVVAEGDSGFTTISYMVYRSGSATGETSVNWSVTGQEDLWGDGYQPASIDDFIETSGTLTFSDGQVSQLLTIQVAGDVSGEFSELFAITLDDPAFGSTVGGDSVYGVIENDDPAVMISADQSSWNEGDTDTTQLTFTVVRTGDLSQVSSVEWRVAPTGDSPVQALDFGGYFPSGVVSFTPGQSEQTVTINVVGDAVGEVDESFQVVLSNGINVDIIKESAESVIANDDTALVLAAADGVNSEGDDGEVTVYTYTVDRLGPDSEPVTVNWRVSGSGTYWADVDDFVSGQDVLGDNNGMPSGTVIIPGGQSQATIEIMVAGDNVTGDDEGFTVSLENPTGATVAAAEAEGSIVNDDSSYSITALDGVKDEGDDGVTGYQFDITRTGDVSSVSSISWRVVGTGDNPVDGDDFSGDLLPSGTVVFDADVYSQTVEVLVQGDGFIESQEGFKVELVSTSDNSSINPEAASATALVNNDDTATEGDDVLIGTAGSDTIEGLGGDDLLTGGDGADRFVFGAPSDGVDTITDFDVTEDQLVFTTGEFGTLGTSGVLVSAPGQSFDTDVATTLSQLAAQADADVYTVSFEADTFTFGYGDEGDLDELEAAFSDSEHTGSATIAISTGDGTTRIYYDADTSTGDDGSGMQEIAELQNVNDANALADTNVDTQVA